MDKDKTDKTDKTVIQKFFEKFDDEEAQVMRKARQKTKKGNEAIKICPEENKTKEENKGDAWQKVKSKNRISQLDLWG